MSASQAMETGPESTPFGVRRPLRNLEARPAEPVPVASLDSLEEICSWLGTFQVRLQEARADEKPGVAAMVIELEARFKQRRAELA